MLATKKRLSQMRKEDIKKGLVPEPSKNSKLGVNYPSSATNHRAASVDFFKKIQGQTQ